MEMKIQQVLVGRVNKFWTVKVVRNVKVVGDWIVRQFVVVK